MASSKVPVYSLNDLKNTTDDAFTYLVRLPSQYAFKRNNTTTDVRLIVGYTAVIIAGVTFYLDRQLGWEATEAAWVKAAVVAYFTLNSILTFWIWAVDAGEVFKGERKSGERITIKSSTQKHSPLYKLKITYADKSGKVIQHKEIEAPFTVWFSSEGVFHPEPLRKWLASEIEILSEAEKEIIQETKGKTK
ncbi:uncharacterized protein TRUGW13939_02253 [Talaromyces rugulosus]|uniref:Signal peptidase complex subunit 2 n=1 Tax=Talaromyces rugulosus TaxID=121627 RepID=A0A7H8QNX2_TALRU|nr:uncharacterized protein TRUGW13939_02253 [Talaromyces rugulosus]QKX55161.1 hypothetical protein TRUGW13939_02253 [Talaromyces rugulosus]